MEAIILAGGKGTRLASVVSGPKAMAPIAGRPFLEYLLQRFAQKGGERVVLSVGLGGDVLIRHFGNSFAGMELAWAREAKPLGTGGALQFAATFAQSPHVLALNGDTYAEIDYQDMLGIHARSGALWTMGLIGVDDVSRYGSVCVSGPCVTAFVEKGRRGAGLINSGVYAFSPKVFGGFILPAAFSLEDEFLSARLGELQPQAFITQGYFIDIGVPADYERAQKELPGKVGC